MAAPVSTTPLRDSSPWSGHLGVGFISRGICGGHVRYLRAKLQEPVAATAAGSAAEVTSHVSTADNRGTNHRRCCCSSMDSYARDRTAAINQNGNLSEF